MGTGYENLSVGMNDKILEPMIHELDIVDEIGELGKDLVALKQPRKATSYLPTAIRIIFKE